MKIVNALNNNPRIHQQTAVISTKVEFMIKTIFHGLEVLR